MKNHFPQKPCPKPAVDKWRVVDEVDLETVTVGTLVEFRGSHSESKYLMQIVVEDGERFVDLWFKERPGCFRSSASEWNNPEHHRAVKVGFGYCVPHFYYDSNGLMKMGIYEPRCEGFRSIRFQ